MSFDAPDYLASLRSFVDAYEGPAQRAVALAPAVFEFYARLFGDTTLSRDARAMVNAVLAYFVVPEDVLSEAELGPFGLVDDLFVAGHVFRILRRELAPGVVKHAWAGEGDVDEVMETVYGESKNELGKRAREVLRLAGLG
jgi:uncharacterized membrane protein YkvA (DUF1232 family)